MINCTRYLLTLSVVVSAALLSGCNDNIFIKPLKVETDTEALGPDCRTAHISVSGEDWSVQYFWFHTEYDSYSGTLSGDSYTFTTPYAELSGHLTGDGIVVDLSYYLGSSPAYLDLTLTDGFEDKNVKLTVNPTEEYVIDVLDIDYTLHSWTGYPDKDYSMGLMSYITSGSDKPVDFSFQKPETVLMYYCFEPFDPEDFFAARVAGCGVTVPIPSRSENGFYWEMTGEEARLQTSITRHATTVMPPLPEPVTIPAGGPMQLRLICDYECVGIDCTITAVNPGNGQPEKVNCQLKMLVPVQFRTEISELSSQ